MARARVRFMFGCAGLVSCVLAVASLEARTWRSTQIPNGGVAGCVTCHFSPQGGDARNAFGAAVEELVPAGSAMNFWGPELAALDSDGDGRTNGEELLDPAGMWTPGDPHPGDAAEVTNPGGNLYIRGDANTDTRVNIADGIYVLEVLFSGASLSDCPDALDADATGNLNLADAVFLINFLFSGGPPPSAPYPDCGAAHRLGCEKAVCATETDDGHDHEHEHEHSEILIGVNAEGRLELSLGDEPVALPPVDGLLSGWATDGFGIVSVTQDDAATGLRRLGPGVEIVLEVVRLDPAFSIYSPGFTDRLSRPGDRWTLGAIPFHMHPAWHIDSEDAAFDPEQAAWLARVRFLDTGSTGYGPSSEYRLTFVQGEHEDPVDAGPPSVRSVLKLPQHLAAPAIPDYNPLTAEKIELGRHLFYDTRLSANQTQSCASCHDQRLAFSDGLATAVGSTGQVHPRNSQGLANVAYVTTLTWGNNVLLELEDQIRVPILSDNPIELGVTDGVRDEVVARFASDPLYQELFARAFPDGDGSVTLNRIVFVLASFCRALISGNSAYDRYYLGDRQALTEQQVRGLRLFNSEKFECFHCHSGVNFTISYKDHLTTPDTITYPFFNNGLYNLGGDGSYPPGNQGIYELTQNPRHHGFFRPQSLRNVALTAPYMHDGSIATLREVVEHYARGGRLVTSGPYAGDGAQNPLKSGLIRGFDATDAEIDDVVAFLESLTDNSFITNPAFSNPFTAPAE